MVVLTEICDGLDIKDRREGGVKNHSFSGRCSWVDGDILSGEGNTAGRCLGKVGEENEFSIRFEL